MTETTESKSTLDIASGSDSTGSKEALVESEIGTTRLSVDEGARRKRLLYAGLLAAGTLAVTAMIIAGFASSAGSVERGAVGATTDFEETENPWPTAQGRILTKEEDNYYYYRTRSTEKDTAAGADTKPNSKRSPSQARKKKRRPKTTVRRTKPTTVVTTLPDVSTVPPEDRSQETEQPTGHQGGDVGEEHATRPARVAPPSKRTRKPPTRLLLPDGTESTHKSTQVTPSEDKSRTG